MRVCLAIFAFVCAGLLVTVDANFAQDKKKEKKTVVLKGLVACNKCELNKSTVCETVLVVKNKKKKDVIYFFDAESHKKYHDGICAAAKNGTVTGIVTEKKKKLTISVKTVVYE
ncbi:MAG: hypothetical protein HYX68_03490 [Planctomycetes bacterium]|jgi:hypothetical protein|nr:hypothetical protein [Planctomycetota bacterium]